jgi:HlyD family secretion protein
LSLLATRRSPLILLTALVLALLVLSQLWQRWQGQLVDGHRLQTQTLAVQVVASGEVRSQSLARIGSEVTGVLAARHVREGDVVKAGDLLLELRNEQQLAQVGELAAALQALTVVAKPQAMATLREAEDALKRAARELARRQTLSASSQVSQEQLEQARSADVAALAARDRAKAQLNALVNGGTEEQQLQQRLAAARAQLAKTTIRANVDGVVQTRNVEPGDLVQPGITLLEIARTDSREIVVPVDEKIFAGIALGQHATIIADAYPERLLAATVAFIAPAVDSARGTVDVHLQVADTANADFLLQGMTVTATILTAERSAVVVVPNDLLRSVEGNKAHVLRVKDNTVERVAVTLGLRGLVASEATDGVGAGDVLVSTDVEPSTRVRVHVSNADTNTKAATGNKD